MLNTPHGSRGQQAGFAVTNEQADALAKRIINTFRLTPALPEWREALGPLEQTTAERTFVQLRDTVDGALSIARYLARHAELVAETRLPARRRPRPDCEHCGGDGWIDCTDDRRHAPHCITPDDCHCHAVVPCPCVAPPVHLPAGATTPGLFE